jgi:hypothetical protein
MLLFRRAASSSRPRIACEYASAVSRTEEWPRRSEVPIASERAHAIRGIGAILGLFESERAGTALARQQSVARFWQVGRTN